MESKLDRESRHHTGGSHGWFIPGCLIATWWLGHFRHQQSTDPSGSIRFNLSCYRGEIIKWPPCSPVLNAFAERWVRSAWELCAERMILFGGQSLRSELVELEMYDNQQRPHQGLHSKIIKTEDQVAVEGDLGACFTLTTGRLPETGDIWTFGMLGLPGLCRSGSR